MKGNTSYIILNLKYFGVVVNFLIIAGWLVGEWIFLRLEHEWKIDQLKYLHYKVEHGSRD